MYLYSISVFVNCQASGTVFSRQMQETSGTLLEHCYFVFVFCVGVFCIFVYSFVTAGAGHIRLSGFFVAKGNTISYSFKRPGVRRGF